VRLELDDLAPLDRRTETVLYRIVQECLSNAAKHSGCTAINLSLASADGWLRMRVKDNGSGFRVEDALSKPGSFGLAGIRERVALAGGRCSIVSHPARAAGPARRQMVRARAGQGTSIEVQLPVLPVPASRPPSREISPARELSPA
jgi:signal transduction histidine kinase